jgi:hypothetical protein
MARRTYAHRSDVAKFNYRATFVYSPAENTNPQGLVELHCARAVDGLRFSATDMAHVQGLGVNQAPACFGNIGNTTGDTTGNGQVKFYRDDVVTIGDPDCQDQYATKFIMPQLVAANKSTPYRPIDTASEKISTKPELVDQWIGGTEGVHRYRRYVVLGSKITVRAVPEPQASSTIANKEFNRQEVANLYLGKCDKKASVAGQYIGAPAVENSESRSNQMLKKLPFISSSQVRINNVNEQAKNAVTMTATYSAKRMNGVSDAKDNKNLYGYIDTDGTMKSPIDNHNFEFGIAPQFDGVQTMPGYITEDSLHLAYPKMRIRLHVFISYTVQMSDPLAQTNIPRPIMMSRPGWGSKAYQFAKGTVYKTSQNPKTWKYLQQMLMSGALGRIGYAHRRALGWR